MKILAFHTTGNANVKSAVYGFIKSGILQDFYVTIAVIPGDALDKVSALPGLAEIRRRKFDIAFKPFAHSYPWYEVGRMAALKFGIKALTQKKTAPFFIDKIVQKLDRHVAGKLKQAKAKGLNAVYGYEDLSIFTFTEAKKLGLQCFYDLPIGYWRNARRLLDGEKERWPDWVATMPALSDWSEKLERKDEELRLADRIFVASTFTANSLKDYPGKLAPVKVIPYGFPPVPATPRQYEGFENNRPVRLLFVGSLSQRKGIADMFAAVAHFGNQFSLTVVGTMPARDCPALDKALALHTYIPSLPHEGILKLMRESDILVFPSLFEGFGLVITEAMSQGTPVITTDRTAGPDLITNGENGWLIEAASTQALIDCFQQVLDDPGKIAVLGKAAMETARLRPWEVYGKELAEAIIYSDQLDLALGLKPD